MATTYGVTMSAKLKLITEHYKSPDCTALEIKSHHSIMDASTGKGEGEEIIDTGDD